MSCPVCGHVDGACAGQVKTNERQIITMAGTSTVKGPERVPRQRRGIGRAGYVGEGGPRVEVYDPDAPNIRLVQDTMAELDDDEDAEVSASPAAETSALVPFTVETVTGFTDTTGEEAEAPKPRRSRKKKDDDGD